MTLPGQPATWRERLDLALFRAARTGCQRPFRFSLPPDAWRAVVAENDAGRPFLGTPPKGTSANASYKGVPVYYALRGSRPWLWVVARDGQLGALKPEPVT